MTLFKVSFCQLQVKVSRLLALAKRNAHVNLPKTRLSALDVEIPMKGR